MEALQCPYLRISDNFELASCLQISHVTVVAAIRILYAFTLMGSTTECQNELHLSCVGNATSGTYQYLAHHEIVKPMNPWDSVSTITC